MEIARIPTSHNSRDIKAGNKIPTGINFAHEIVQKMQKEISNVLKDVL